MLGASYLRVHRYWLVSIANVSAMEREDSDCVVRRGPVGHAAALDAGRINEEQALSYRVFAAFQRPATADRARVSTVIGRRAGAAHTIPTCESADMTVQLANTF